jgi:hypothetical protein
MKEDTLQARMFRLIHDERIKQDAKFGEQNHNPQGWLMIIGEELGECNKAVLDKVLLNVPGSTLLDYRDELVQLAACCVSALESFYRNELNRI